MTRLLLGCVLFSLLALTLSQAQHHGGLEGEEDVEVTEHSHETGGSEGELDRLLNELQNLNRVLHTLEGQGTTVADGHLQYDELDSEATEASEADEAAVDEAAADDAGLQLLDFKIVKATLNAAESQTAEFFVSIKAEKGLYDDEVLGDTVSVVRSQAIFVGPRSQTLYGEFIPSKRLVLGDKFEGSYMFSAVVPQFNANGLWVLYALYMTDSTGRSVFVARELMITKGFDTKFSVVGSLTDLAPPVVNHISFTAANQVIALGIQIIDEGSGLRYFHETVSEETQRKNQTTSK